MYYVILYYIILYCIILYYIILYYIILYYIILYYYRRDEVRGWQNTVEIVLFDISNSMKPYASVFHAYTSKLRPVIILLSQTDSMRFPSVFRQPLM